MLRCMTDLPDELLEKISSYLLFEGKRRIRLSCKNCFRVNRYIEIRKLIMEDLINNTYIPLNNSYIPFGMLFNWTLHYPFFNYYSDRDKNMMSVYLISIKCCTIYRYTLKDHILIWSNKNREKYVK